MLQVYCIIMERRITQGRNKTILSNDLCNADEPALFYKLILNKTLAFQVKQCTGSKSLQESTWRSSCSIHYVVVIMSHLQVDHTYLTHSHLVSRKPPPMCIPSNVQLCIWHLLLYCKGDNVRCERFYLLCNICLVLADDPDILTQIVAFL
jgi:hypothetical protein